MRGRTGLWWLSLACAGCGADVASSGNVAPVDTATASPGAVPDDPVAAEEHTPKAPPPAEPVDLAVVAEGRCNALDVSFLGEETFLHARGWVARMGKDGRVQERLDTSRPGVIEAKWSRYDNEVQSLAGHYPAPMVVLMHRGLRGDSYIGTDLMKRTAEGRWADMDLFGADGYVRQAWPWYDDSVLVLGERRWAAQGERGTEAWSSAHETAVRLGVARGAPKAPHLSAFKTAGSNCPLDVWSMEATPRGDVVALVGCSVRTVAQNHGVWVMQWFRDDLEGTIQKLSERDVSDGHVVIGREGASWVAIEERDGSDFEIYGLTEGQWKPVPAPKDAPLVDLAIDPQQRLWLATRGAVLRAGDGQWDPVGPPDAAKIHDLAGVEHGTPWVLDEHGAWAADERGAWALATVPRPAWFPDEGPLRLQRVRVPRAGEVWIRAEYGSPWPADMGNTVIIRPVDFTALLSNAKPSAALRCGVAVDPGQHPIDLRPWPTGYREGCTTKLMMLMRITRFGKLDGYNGLRKLLREHESLRELPIVEVQGSGAKLVGALVSDAAQVQLLSDGVRGYRSMMSKPELTCGDAASLAAADFEIVRTMTLDADGRRFQEVQ